MLAKLSFLLFILVPLIHSTEDSWGLYVDDDHYHPELRRHEITTKAEVNLRETSASFWVDSAQEAIDKKTEEPNENVAKNVIFFIGDGMTVPNLATARIYMGQLEGNTGEESEMSFEQFPTVGLAKTYCVDYQVPDSACTATAYLCGIKSNLGTIGVTASVPRSQCAASLVDENTVDSIAQWAIDAGKDAGFVTTTRVTHASPAGTFAKTANRNWETDAAVPTGQGCEDIAHQLIHRDPGNKFKVIMGGGRQYMTANTTVDVEYDGTIGLRTDGRNLIEEWQTDKLSKNSTYSYVWLRDQLQNVDFNNTDYLLGLFEPNHLQYHLLTNPVTEPTLEEMTEAAIKILSKNDVGYFLFVEAGRIDHAHHANRAQRAMAETVELEKAVRRASELTSTDNTLIVVSSDHSHVMTFNGYPRRGSDILGMTGNLGDDGVPYLTMSYTNGPGQRNQVYREDGTLVRPDLSLVDYLNPSFRNTAEVPLSSETHGGDDVAVFANGPHNHLFTGLYEQHHLPHLMAYAACIGPGITFCSTESSGMSLRIDLTIFLIPIIVFLLTKSS